MMKLMAVVWLEVDGFSGGVTGSGVIDRNADKMCLLVVCCDRVIGNDSLHNTVYSAQHCASLHDTVLLSTILC